MGTTDNMTEKEMTEEIKESRMTVRMTKEALYDFLLFHAYSKFSGFLVNILGLAQRIVRKVVKSESKAVTVDDIINVVCKHFSLDTATIHTKSRKREVVQARQIAMFLAKSYTDFSTAKIGTLIGNKDHATVLHACKTIKELREVDKAFRAEIDDIQASLKKQG